MKKRKIKCNIDVLLKERGISQCKFERISGIKQSTIRSHKLGIAKRIDYDTILKICETLCVKPGELFTIE